jgi:hypothetical protein
VAAGVWVVLKVALCHIIAAHLLPAILGHVVNCTAAAAAAAAAQQQHNYYVGFNDAASGGCIWSVQANASI